MLLTKLQPPFGSHHFPLMSFFLFLDPIQHTTALNHVSFVSLELWQILSFVFHEFDSFKACSWDSFVECSSMWIFRVIFWWLHWDYWFGVRISWKWSVLLITLYEYMMLTWYQVISSSDNNLNHLVKWQILYCSLLFSLFPYLSKSLSPAQTQVCVRGWN